jgi:hypothetical protein
MNIPRQSDSVNRGVDLAAARTSLVRASAVRSRAPWPSPGDYNTCYAECTQRGKNPFECLSECWPVGGTGPFNPFPTATVM